MASGDDPGSDGDRYDASVQTAVDFDEITMAFTYEYSDQEGGTLIVDERLPDHGDFEFFHRGLYYQFVPAEAPTGETFAGDHGFRGLAYVQPPGSTAEAQYICVAQDDGSD